MKTEYGEEGVDPEQVTRAAIEAVKEGKWDVVNTLYAHRAANRQLENVSPTIAKRLIEWDRWVVMRIREAQAAIAQNIEDIQDRKRKLSLLKEQWGHTRSVQSRHLTSV